jgi:hypothetical protein
MIYKLHNCKRCGYSTNIKGNFKKHLQRKTLCKPKLSNIPLELIQESYNIFVNKDQNEDTQGYCYLIREREFIRMNENIYKIGKTTKEFSQRLAQYPKNSEVIMFIKYDNCHTTERTLLKYAREKFVQQKKYGNEYFLIDDIKDMMKIFLKPL